MKVEERKSKEKSINNFFKRGYKNDLNRIKDADVDKFSKTAKIHVEKITETQSKSALDVGCGTGGILLALQKKGVEQIYGVELCGEGIEVAKKRFEEYGDIEKANFFQGSIFEYTIPNVDAITIHNVMSCHPDAKGIAIKILEGNPNQIVNSMPRNIAILRIIAFILSIFTKLFMNGFKLYVHDTDEIRKLIEDAGYERVDYMKGFYWETSVFIKI
ncbi:MAG: class I SAM-dependent methyltransferase [Candidatus Heimdallarchaeota archaeon]|nr:class I SAM-dependent methyltransferase [Candidatus Heimdallarchaeota archaeon]MDH5646318.1 class I SAM-dependent methyltransferase [Candidatus Heimdallarchaeota archaeon]